MASEIVLFSYLKAYRCIFTTSRRRRRSAPLVARPMRPSKLARPCRLPNPDRHTYNPKTPLRACIGTARPSTILVRTSPRITQHRNHTSVKSRRRSSAQQEIASTSTHRTKGCMRMNPQHSQAQLSHGRRYTSPPHRAVQRNTDTDTDTSQSRMLMEPSASKRVAPLRRKGYYASSC